MNSTGHLIGVLRFPQHLPALLTLEGHKRAEEVAKKLALRGNERLNKAL
jgi:hypothetical protein